MQTRRVEVTIVMSKLGQLVPNQVKFVLECDPQTTITEQQTFEIVWPGRESVRGTPLTGQVVNRSDGVTTVRMLGDDRHHDLRTLLNRLERLPNVSNIMAG